MDAKKPDNDNEDDNEDDIDLLSKEEKEEKLQKKFIECLNSFNECAISECLAYLEKLPFEVIKAVLIKTSGIIKPNWNYAKTILDDYVRRKIDSIEKMEIEKENFKKTNAEETKKKSYQNYEQRDIKNFDEFYSN